MWLLNLIIEPGGGKILTHEIQKEITHAMKVGEFACDDRIVTSDDSSIYTMHNDRINVRSFQVAASSLYVLCPLGVN
jgi:hypothetical protein